MTQKSTSAHTLFNFKGQMSFKLQRQSSSGREKTSLIAPDKVGGASVWMMAFQRYVFKYTYSTSVMVTLAWTRSFQIPGRGSLAPSGGMTGDSPVKKTSKHVGGRQSLSAKRAVSWRRPLGSNSSAAIGNTSLLGSFVCPSGFPAFSGHFCAPGLWKSVAELQQQIRLLCFFYTNWSARCYGSRQ